MERDEALEVFGGLELFVQGVELFTGVGEVLGRRDHFPHHVFDVAVGRLLELLFAVVVVTADFFGRDLNGGIHRVRDGDEDKVGVDRRVALGDEAGFLQVGEHVALFNERAVFGVKLIAIDAFLQERPVGRGGAAVVGVDRLDEVGQGLTAECAVGTREHSLLQEHRRNVGALGQVEHLLLTDGQAGRGGLGDEHFVVEDRLPGRIAKLGLLLFGRRIPAHQLGDLGVGAEFVVKIFIGNGFSVHRTDFVVGRETIGR